MSTHARLYATESGWNAANAQIMEALGGGVINASTYDEITQVDNPDHADYGKYVLSIESAGPYKCNQVFASGNVARDTTWFVDALPTGDPPE